MATMYIVWTFLMLLLRGKSGRIVAVICMMISLAVIVNLTIVGRSEGGEVVLIPFGTLVKGFAQPNYLRSAFMNILLFSPFGLTLPYILPDQIRRKVLFTVLAGMLVSVSVEAVQFLFTIGNTELDDVLMNTLGTFLGATSWRVYVIIRNKYDTWLR